MIVSYLSLNHLYMENGIQLHISMSSYGSGGEISLNFSRTSINSNISKLTAKKENFKVGKQEFLFSNISHTYYFSYFHSNLMKRHFKWLFSVW